MKRRAIYILAGITLMISFSCKKYLTVDPSGYIPVSQSFKTADDAITSVYGLYSLMQPLVDQIFLAGEVQADMVVAARGADANIAEIAQNRITPQNPYTDYSKFYKLIVACNNTLVGLKQITVSDPVNYTSVMYNSNVAEVMYIRSWAYLQMVKIWGDVPYVDFSVTSIDQIQNIAATKADTILARIQSDAVKYYPIMLTANPISNAAAGQNIAGSELRNFRAQFNSYAGMCLLTELYVYTGNYSKAKDIIGQLLPYGNAGNGTDIGVFGMTDGNYGYNNYDKIFMSYTTGTANDSRALFIDFDGSKGQTNSLEKWTNNDISNGGIYAIKPSPNAIAYFNQAPSILLNYQNTSLGYYVNLTQSAANGSFNAVLNSDGTPIIAGYGDVVRGSGLSYMPQGKDTIIFKYMMKSHGVIKNAQQNDNNSKDDALFFVYRDGPMYLLTCEIYNHLGLSNEALTMMNGGLNGSAFKGTRYRARVGPLSLDPAYPGTLVKQVDNLMLQEKALEGSYEGLRWFDLVRIAKVNNDPSILANAVAKKYPASQQAAIIARLSNPNYWYFPFYQKNIDANKLLKQKPGY